MRALPDPPTVTSPPTPPAIGKHAVCTCSSTDLFLHTTRFSIFISFSVLHLNSILLLCSIERFNEYILDVAASQPAFNQEGSTTRTIRKSRKYNFVREVKLRSAGTVVGGVLLVCVGSCRLAAVLMSLQSSLHHLGAMGQHPGS